MTPVLYVAEPPRPWAALRPTVVDCSVIAALIFDEPTAQAAAALLTGKALHAPALLPYEMANVACRKLRAGASVPEIERALADFSQQTVELHPGEPISTAQLAQRYSLSAYDAAYLVLAAALRAPLATFDRQLGEAAQRHLSSLQ
jgi:predicted nucleic acid-binding protein